jgi:hypothetical protein
MKRTDTQLVLLSAASQREDGTVEIGSKLKGGAADKMIGKLLRLPPSRKGDTCRPSRAGPTNRTVVWSTQSAAGIAEGSNPSPRKRNRSLAACARKFRILKTRPAETRREI